MKIKHMLWLVALTTLFVWGCDGNTTNQQNGGSDSLSVDSTASVEDDSLFKWVADEFADIRVLRYKVPGFAELPLEQKKLLYFLSQAATSGRDIIYDQNYKHNILVRRTLENIFKTYNGEKSGEQWTAFHTYLKQVWYSNGIHHHYSYEKHEPGFDYAYFETLVKGSDQAKFPLERGETVDMLLAKLKPVLFDPKVDFKRVNKDAGVDPIAASANNNYEGVTLKEDEKFYKAMNVEGDTTPPSYGLNSKLVKSGNQLIEKTWKVGGMYGQAIEQIVSWLKKATDVMTNPKQKKATELLIEYYETGDLKKFDAYNLAWIEDKEGDVDFINGFIEVYGDAIGRRGAYESVVQLTDPIASKRIAAIAKDAQWFEDNSPIMDAHKKKEVTGISAKVINVVMEAGDASPSTPIGINLPNADWIRAIGSKSVNLANIVEAYDQAGKRTGILEEFAWDEAEVTLSRKFGGLPSNLHTDMHEVIGHASGQVNPGVGTPHETLGKYASTLEEGRADLVALYYLMDPKLVELGVMPSIEVGKAQYSDYIRNGMMLQLRRLKLGKNIEEDHMRNRQLICKWVLEKGKKDNVVEQRVREGKTYFVVNNYEKLRELFGQLLREIQRIKSEGDMKAATALVEGYGVKVDQKLHKEVLDRVEALKIPPYSGFINPVLSPVLDGKGNIIDIKIEYPDDFTQQHLYYGEKYSFLPNVN
ncbi:MAG TPA: dihydrofolate reductase [Bacteroidia bacterium]|nr:dihydrofolate reductase [Bacteroidia bacterium]